jgi:uncharacterized protein
VTPLRAVETESGRVVAERVRRAATHWTRLKGLLGTRVLPEGDGLWITPCRQVHTVGMRYAIDLVFLDDVRRVVETVRALAPGRFSARVAAATSVLELPAGTVDRTGLLVGSVLDIA